MGNFLSHVTIKFNGWPWKTIGHLFFTTSSFVHHLKPLSELKLKLQSGNAQFWSKSAILSHMTLKFDGRPWKTKQYIFYATSSFVHHFKAIGEFKLELQSGNTQNSSENSQFFVPCDLEIKRMTLKNKRLPLICYFKLCASFLNHWYIQTGVTVWKCSIWVIIDNFLTMWP